MIRSRSLTTLPHRYAVEPHTAVAPFVLHVRVVAGSGGGPDKTILRSARHTDPSRLNLAAAYIHPTDDPGFDTLRKQARELGCPLWEIAESGPLDPRTVTQMLRLCRRLGVSVWHAHDYKSNLMGLLLARLHPMKLMTTVHGWTDETARTRVYRRVDEFCLPHYERVIAVSRTLERRCLELGVRRERLTYIPNGIESRSFRRRRETADAKASLGINPETSLIGVVGRLSVEKGIDRAVRAFADLRRSLPDAELHLVGDGPERARIEAMARELHITDAIHIHGWQSDPRPFYEAMDLLLLPSRTEGMPNAVLEAMAMEAPVAATDVGGVRELLGDGECGVILSDDESDWAASITALLRDESLRHRMARRARVSVENTYAFEARVAREMEVYGSLVELPPAAVRTSNRRAA